MRVVIVDDEALGRAKLRRLLAAVPDVTLVGEADGGEQALRVIRESRPDVVFLDIRMEDMSGFDVVAALGDQPMPLIVFATAYDSFAVQAFQVHALDYLLKPFDAERLEATVARAREALARKLPADRESLLALLEELRAQRALLERAHLRPAREYAHHLMVRRGQDLVPVEVSAIDWIGAADNYVELHVGRDTHLLRETMQAVEVRLDPREFIRIHRRTLVNRAQVSSVRLQASNEYAVVLRDGTSLPVGRSYRAQVSARWQGAAPDLR